MSGRRRSSHADSFHATAATLGPSPNSGELPTTVPEGFPIFKSRLRLAAVAAAFLKHEAVDTGPGTQENHKKFFRYFEQFLDPYEKRFGVKVEDIESITQQVVDDYWGWMEGDDVLGSSLDLRGTTRNIRIGALRRFIDWVETLYPLHCPRIDFSGLRYAGAHNEIQHRGTLSLLDTARLRAGCISEIESKLATWKDTWEGIESLPAIDNDFICTADPREFECRYRQMQALDFVYQRVPVFGDQFRAFAPGLARSMTSPNDVQIEVLERMYPIARSMLPFILMIALESNFNPSTQLGLIWEHVKRQHPLYGDKRWQLLAPKLRPFMQLQDRSFAVDESDPFCVPSLLTSVEWITAKFRPTVPKKHRNHVFVVFNGLDKPPTALLDDYREATGPLSRATAQFREEYDLPYFTLATIRPTGADIVSDMTGGDLPAQKTFQQHSSISTLEISYTTERAKRQRAESLAHAINERERYIFSRGKISPVSDVPPLASSATPGLFCMDPMASPMPGQRNGRLCDAYGMCPVCPHAAFDRTSALNVARLIQFRATITACRSKIAPVRFHAVWQPVLDAIGGVFLAAVTGATMSLAMSMTINPFSEVE